MSALADGPPGARLRALDSVLAALAWLATAALAAAAAGCASPAPTQQWLAANELFLDYRITTSGVELAADCAGRTTVHALAADLPSLAASAAVLSRQLDPSDVGTIDRMPAYDMAEAARLADALRIGAALVECPSARHVIVAAEGPLAAVPFAALVLDMPATGGGNDRDPFAAYRRARWFGQAVALSHVASGGWIERRRRAGSADRPPPPEPLLALADPLPVPPDAPAAAAPLAWKMADEDDALEPSPPGTPDARQTADRGWASLRRLARVPLTADQAVALAAAYGAGPGAILLREAATERALRRLDLGRYRTLAFATHGLVPGEFDGLTEPALLLTLPPGRTDEDDGLLLASEVRALKLRAAWVLLLACNTGSRIAAGSMTSAFLDAGAGAVLGARWPVISEVVTDFVAALARLAPADLPLAEAVRRASLAVADDPIRPHHAHPMLWAPFAVSGDGALRARGRAR